MNKNFKFTAAKMIKLIAVSAPIVLFILLSFCYIGRYAYGNYYGEYYSCSFYDTLIFDEISYRVLYDYYITVGVINWLLFLPLLIIPILALVSIFVFKSKVSNIVCGVGCGLTLGISFLVLIEGICVIVIGGSSLSTLAYIPFIIMLLVTATYFILRFVFKKEFKADANNVDVNTQNNNGGENNNSQNNSSTQGANSQGKTNSAKKSMGMFIVCLLFIPFYLYYWIYKTTEYLNCALSEKKRDPMVTLLLCLFIPFYSIYWTYVSAKSIDELAKQTGISSDIATMCLITSFIAGIIPPILMQQKINEIESIELQYTTPKPEQTENTANNNSNSDIAESAVDIADEIKKYKELLDIGAITQEEYDAKKASLLYK